MGTMVSFRRPDGQELQGYLAEPAQPNGAPAVVVIQEWWGLNDQIRGVADRLAHAGYLALVPDLYRGKKTAEEEEAHHLMTGLNFGDAATQDVRGAVQYLKTRAAKVGCVGFCMGGALTLAASCFVEGLACAVPFYGVPSTPLDAFAKVRTPIQAHFAKKDDWAKPEKAEQIQAKVRSGGGHMDLFVYDAGHAFMRDGDPSHYDADAAKLAWDRALEFLKKHLA